MQFPVVSLAHKTIEELVKDIDVACRELGFFIVVDHGISESVVNLAWQSARSFFDLELDDKQAVPMTDEYPYGYSGFSEESLSQSLGAYNSSDLKESFCIGPLQPYLGRAAVRWPQSPDDLRNSWTKYYQEMELLSARLLKIFALALSLPEDWFCKKTEQHSSALRALNYPAISDKKLLNSSVLRAGAHRDYGVLTILKSGGPGLQMKTSSGEWLDLPQIENGFFVSLGDLMAIWTNDRWLSPLHRVRIQTLERRQSLAFFHNANDDALVECIESCCQDIPARYAPVVAGEYLMEKHRAATQKT